MPLASRRLAGGGLRAKCDETDVGEDELELSNALVVILKHSNYSVDAVYNGRDALDYLTCGSYDGAILGMMMGRYFVYKQAVLREAGRLVEAGVIRETEDVYYLRFEELCEVVRTGKLDH